MKKQKKKQFKRVVWVGYLDYPPGAYDVYWTKQRALEFGAIKTVRCELREI